LKTKSVNIHAHLHWMSKELLVVLCFFCCVD